MAHSLEIIEADESRGYVLKHEYRDADDHWDWSYVPVENTGDDLDCMKRLLEAVAEHFGYSYNKFGEDNLVISFTGKDTRLTKAEADRILRRIYSRLKECQTDVKLNSNLGGVFGQISAKAEISESGLTFDHLIEINPKKSGRSFMRTVLHECLHLANWNKSEKEIDRLESGMFENISDRQLTNLVKRVFG